MSFQQVALMCCLWVSACAAPTPNPMIQELRNEALKLEHPLLSAGPLDFSLRRHPSSEKVSLSSLRGTVVMLDVWATWCEPCRDTLPLYQDLQKEYGPKGFKVLALNVDADVEQVNKFLIQTPLTLEVLLDPNAEFAENMLRVRMMPTAFLIDRKGRVRYVHEGFAEEFLSKYAHEITELVNEAP